MSATKVADRQLLTPPGGGGGGSITLTEVEIDFGTNPISSKSFTIADALVTGPTKKILVYTSPNPGTDRVGNDWELDMPFFSAVAGTGDFTLSVVFPHHVVGKRKINYQII
jgi:hypothetical protein